MAFKTSTLYILKLNEIFACLFKHIGDRSNSVQAPEIVSFGFCRNGLAILVLYTL